MRWANVSSVGPSSKRRAEGFRSDEGPNTTLLSFHCKNLTFVLIRLHDVANLHVSFPHQRGTTWHHSSFRN